MSPSLRIGWIGTGVMGISMCRHIMKAGYNMTVYNRTASKCEPLVELGATLASTPKEVAKNSDVVFTIVGYPSDVEAVILGEDGVLNNLKEGGIVVDMTTSTPSLAVKIAEAAAAQGKFSLDAPVSGGDLGAREARLSIMIGGDESATATCMPLFHAMGKNINRLGDAGAGQHCKLTNQILIASGMVGVVEGLTYARAAKIDRQLTVKAIESGAAGSWSLTNLAPKMLNGDFAPGFFVKHFIKDMTIALDEADRMGVKLPGLKLAREHYQSLADDGLDEEGTQALIKAYEKMNRAVFEN